MFWVTLASSGIYLRPCYFLITLSILKLGLWTFHLSFVCCSSSVTLTLSDNCCITCNARQPKDTAAAAATAAAHVDVFIYLFLFLRSVSSHLVF